MAYNTNEERLLVKGSERVTRDLQVTGDVYVGGDLTVNNATIGELNVANIIANGSTGIDGQVIGKENGNINWINIPDPIDADNFAVNNITINNSATLNGFSIPAMTIMVEDDYNNLGGQINKSLFYFTTPNGNLYLNGFGYSPDLLPPL